MRILVFPAVLALVAPVLPQDMNRERPCSIILPAGPNATWDARPWIDGVVPYEFDSAVSETNRALMLSAMQRWETLFAVNFREKGQQKDWVYIQNSSGNSANVGRSGGKQFVNIFNWNIQSILIHELGHAIGFWHEHQRPDRDSYVTINWSEIQTGQEYNFYLQPLADALGAYDFDSIMHYSANAWAKGSNPTITVKWPNQSKQNTIGLATLPSPGDMLGSQTVYGTIRIRRASVDSVGTQANQGSDGARISADGRFTAFHSSASNLVSGDTNSAADAFIHDRQTAITTRVSVSSTGAQADGFSLALDISADGRYVLFVSEASNLVAGDTNGVTDVFVHDRQTGVTTRVSVDSTGKQGDKASGNAGGSISQDGSYVVFASDATNLVAGDTNGVSDIFVHNRQTGNTSRVSVSSGGAEANGGSFSPDISGNGRIVAFGSAATNLVNGDTNGYTDIFLHDWVRGTTIRVSIGSYGTEADRGCYEPSMSADGRYIAFSSDARNLGVRGYPYKHIYLHDSVTAATTLVSVNSRAEEGNGQSSFPIVSQNGRYIAFQSYAHNLFSAPGSGQRIFVRDTINKLTSRVDLNAWSGGGNLDSYYPAISTDGQLAVFTSAANDLVYSDTNGFQDVFVHEMEPWRMSSIPASVQQLGKPCQGTRGLPMLYLDKTWPRIGNAAFTVALDNTQLYAPILIGLSGKRQRLGLGSCTLQLDLAISVFFVVNADGFGKASFGLPIPNDPWYRGLPLYAQGFVIDPGGAFQNLLAITNALRLLLAD